MRVMLGDVDRQQSSRTWLALRPARRADDRSLGRSAHDDIVRPPKGTTHVVLDTPAGLHGKRLDEVMKRRRQGADPAAAEPVRHPRDARVHRRAARAPAQRQGADRRGRHARRARTPSPTDQLRQFLDDADGAGARLPARHAELRAPRRARPDAVGRGARAASSATSSSGSRSSNWVELTIEGTSTTIWPSLRTSRWSAQELARQRLDHRRRRQRIDQFADATGDHQWIHVDPRARRQGRPFGTTIAHGFLTLSLLPEMAASRRSRSTTRAWASTTASTGCAFRRRCRRQPAARRASSCSSYEPLDGGAQLTMRGDDGARGLATSRSAWPSRCRAAAIAVSASVGAHEGAADRRPSADPQRRCRP